ncbi:MAG: peptidoglycan D,D-transpeptidase FtsI family protein [Candidatus Merdivicinus sp.]
MQQRVIAFFVSIVILFTLLYLKIGFLSHSDSLLQAAQQQKTYTLTVYESRNAIYDCNFLPLADTFSEDCYVVIPDTENILPVLQAVTPERRQQISDLMSAGKPFVLRNAGTIEATGVEKFSLPVRTASPQLAAHIIGYLDDAGNGVCGIEQSCNEFLSEQPSVTQVSCQLDALGHTIPGLQPEIRQDPISSAGVVLTIDSNIQKIVENAGNRLLKKGAIVVMDPYTGEIKASASFPSYSLENLAQAIRDEENTPMINRALLPFSVGSTFKVVTAAAALEAGLPLDAVYECTGQIDVSGQIIRCHNRYGHGEMDMTDAMMKSCNPYFITLGLQVGGQPLLEMAKRFGFGQELPLSGNVAGAAGSLPAERDLINPAAVANLSFGQGDLMASPLQVTRMMAVACNGGLLVTPRLVQGKTMDGKVIQQEATVPAQQIISPEIAEQLRSILVQCVMVEPEQNALPSNVSAGGKTATAQTGRFDEDGEEFEHGWFSGFFPADAPRYVVTVLSEDSGFGNGTAAPVFAEIAEQITAHGW